MEGIRLWLPPALIRRVVATPAVIAWRIISFSLLALLAFLALAALALSASFGRFVGWARRVFEALLCRVPLFLAEAAFASWIWSYSGGFARLACCFAISSFCVESSHHAQQLVNVCRARRAHDLREHSHGSGDLWYAANSCLDHAYRHSVGEAIFALAHLEP